MIEPLPTVIIIDDDASVREALSSLLRAMEFNVLAFGAVREFLQSPPPDGPSCLILDVRLPGRSGLDFQGDLARRDIYTPIIFITGHGDIPMSVRAMKAGAVEFLAKPFRDQDLLDAIEVALERDRARLVAQAGLADLKVAYATLSAREVEVMARVVTGLLNKQIAGQLGVSEITVKVHRSQVMRKMGARSVADLVRMADRLAPRP